MTTAMAEDEVALQGDAEAQLDAGWSSGHHEQAVPAVQVPIRRRGTIGRTSVVAHILAALEASSCRSVAAFGRVVGEEVAWRRSSWTWCVRDFRWEALEVATRPQAHCRCTPNLRGLLPKGCAAQEHLFLLHEQCPVNWLFFLKDTDLGEVFVEKRNKCMFNDFSAACMAKYKVAGFDEPEAKIVCQQVAQSWNMDIADIESRHASLRRMLTSVVQTHARPSRRQIFGGVAAACWRSRGCLSCGGKKQEERGVHHQKRQGYEIGESHFQQRAVREREGLRRVPQSSAEEYQRLQARGFLVAPAQVVQRHL